jgi:hypothetical protein
VASAKVVVIDETMAKKYFQGRDPIGRAISFVFAQLVFLHDRSLLASQEMPAPVDTESAAWGPRLTRISF